MSQRGSCAQGDSIKAKDRLLFIMSSFFSPFYFFLGGLVFVFYRLFAAQVYSSGFDDMEHRFCNVKEMECGWGEGWGGGYFTLVTNARG